ncbi:MAG: hypothetical protein ACRD2G_12705 [Terriglobia bacterium]
MDIVGWCIGIAGIGAACYWGLDARRLRRKSDRLLQHRSETIHNLKGFLLALKGWSVVNVQQVNDRLQYIKEREEEFQRIEAAQG